MHVPALVIEAVRTWHNDPYEPGNAEAAAQAVRDWAEVDEIDPTLAAFIVFGETI